MEDRYRVRMEGIKKSFGGVKALSGVSLAVRPGEIHALVGENGAGKSTLMKILSGAYQKDEGTIEIDGVPVEIGSPRRGKELGVGIIYQEFELAGDLTVAENIFLDRLSSGKLIDWKRLYEKAEAVLHSLNFDINVKSRVQDLSVAYQQVVEIAKVLSQNAKILILDEPTAVLSPKETAALFETLNKLRSEGVSIIYISHRMEEIFQIADSITIMRDGEVTGTGRRDQMEMNQVIELMIGRKLSTMFPPRAVEMGEEILRVEELEGEAFRRISFSVRRGEVLGISGLVGSGRSEIVRAIFGADRKKSGKVYLNGQEVTIHSPKDAVKLGIGLIPENRKEQGLVLDFAIKHNITMPNIRSVRGFLGVIRQGQENRLAQSLVEKLTVKTDSIDAAVHQLSGGNQQKVVLAKWFNTDSQVIIFDEPTRGVDVGAKIEIYNLINEFAKRNLGVIIISSELNEIIGMCDRTIVIDNGEKKGELKKEELSELNIMKLAVGGNAK
ncbi:sugar ABC transporter ATP-binding protein [Faecalispora jeddahensis]|uniref:sugar ABC transporter ATP-binding protein n=1 Tax=Faecalispora jeddahensis TaxID=1414721 RepID=UPI001A9C0D14|nr:sugar ABC transporter ATP-binding protein [Faecalispora jeddahensis]